MKKRNKERERPGDADKFSIKHSKNQLFDIFLPGSTLNLAAAKIKMADLRHLQIWWCPILNQILITTYYETYDLAVWSG